MPPNSITPTPPHLDDQVENLPKSNLAQGSDGQPASTYPGIWKYPTNRDNKLRSAEDWMECKKKDDDIGSLWRVFDNLYNLIPFIASHPGGSQWIEMSRGTDITEAFVVSHTVNTKVVERMLQNYLVKPASTPRIAPFTLKSDGFYMTLKRRVEPIFKKVGTGPTLQMRMMQDSLALTFLVLAVLGAIWNSMTLAVLSGIFLCFQTIGAHNFFHLRENWRKYYFDLSLNSSFEWRITHAFSHHMYPNTLMDIELQLYPTFQFLPNRPKHWIQKTFSMHYSHITYSIAFWIDIGKRMVHVAKGEKPLRPENLLVILELLLLISLGAEPITGLLVWVVLHTTCSFAMLTIGATASHHHTTCFHDGDEPLADPDFGIGQLDATKDRAENFFNNIFITLITFGHHPLHHLFPTVCHSKLPYVREVFEQTVRDFKLDYPGIPQVELYKTCYEQLARTEPFKRNKSKSD